MQRLGVLGWPVAHSRSPAMHNAALRELGLSDWSYQRLPVPPELFDETVRGLPGAGFVGANVTIPHKQQALALADSASDAARAIGAANTLSFGADGAIFADNTDAPGLLAAIGRDVAGLSALVLGAGGSGRAAAYALKQAGAARVGVWNRTAARATALAADLGVDAVELPLPAADLLIQCTSVELTEMSSVFKVLPLTADALKAYAIVVDLVYRDADTELLDSARAAGCETVDGLEVLVCQGALSFEAWTRRTAPVATMRKAARGAPPQRRDEPRHPAPAPGRRPHGVSGERDG
jgi:shikimate dehydrogenase